MSSNRWVRIAVTVAVAVVAVYFLGYFVPQERDPTQVDLFTQALYVGIAATGLNVLTGFNGQVSIGHGAFFGLGAYTSAILMYDHDWAYLATLPIAAILCLVVGAAIGFPALRVKGLYLALVTLGLAVLFPDLTKRFVNGTGGTNLISLPRDSLDPPFWHDWFSDPIADPLTDWIGARDQWAYYLALLFSLLLLLAVFSFMRTRFGRSLIAVRDHEAAAVSVGVNLARVKVTAFGISALYAGVAGSLSLLVTGTANAERVQTFQISIEFLVALVVGGTATVLGPMLGGFVVVFVRDWIDDQDALVDLLDRQRAELASPAIFGIALILCMYVLPDGIIGGGRRLVRRLTRKRTGDGEGRGPLADAEPSGPFAEPAPT
jgi:branched-chain amino acid transport system permease protein